MASMDSSLAESMNAQVLTTSTSASSAREVIFIPDRRTLPSMISASTRFLAHPRLIMPTFMRRPWSAANVAASTTVGFMAKLLNRDFAVAFAQRFAILANLNRLAIEHAHGNVLTAELHRSI